MTMLDTEDLRAAVLEWDLAHRRRTRATRLADDAAAADADECLRGSAETLASADITNEMVEAARIAYEGTLAEHRAKPTPGSREAHRANAQLLTDLRRAQRIVRDAPPVPDDPDGAVLIALAPTTKEG